MSSFPVAWNATRSARARWLRSALHGFCAEEPGTARTRVCILAEPGAVALLIYAIARLLPPQLVRSFTFSTYEPPHTSLRENKVARVIGSYAKNGLDRTDSDSLRRRSYVVDTLRDAYGPEIQVEPSWPLEGLLTLVADGNWKAVDEVRELWSRDPHVTRGVTPAALAEALKVRPLMSALRAGTIEVSGLSELRRTRMGERLIRSPEFSETAWRAVRKNWAKPEVRAEFADLIGEHLDELIAELRLGIESDPVGKWRERWDALKQLIPPDRRVGCFVSLLEAMGAIPATRSMAANERVGLYREWLRLVRPGEALPAKLQWLFRVRNEREFQALIGSSRNGDREAGLELAHAGLAVCVAFSAGTDWEAGPDLLMAISEDEFRSFLAELEHFDHREALLARIRTDDKLARRIVDRLLETRPKVPAEWIEKLLLSARCDELAWLEYWLKGKHFIDLLTLLDTESNESQLTRRVWDGMVARINADNFDDTSLSEWIEGLVKTSQQFPRSLTREQADRLESWYSLGNHFFAPTQAHGTAANLQAACKVVGESPEKLAERRLRKWVIGASSDLDRAKKDKRLGQALLGFYEDKERACAVALQIAGRLPDSERSRECKIDLFNVIVPETDQDREPLVRRHLAELADTPIQPRIDVDLRGVRSRAKVDARGSKGYLSRLKPYAAAFAGGCVFMLVLILVLLPAINGNWPNFTSWRSSPADEPDPLAGRTTALNEKAKALQDEQERLASIEGDLDRKSKGLNVATDQLNRRSKELDDATERLNREKAQLVEEKERLRVQLAAALPQNQQGGASNSVGGTGGPDAKDAPAPDLNSAGVDGKVPSLTSGKPKAASKDLDQSGGVTKSSEGTGAGLSDQLKMLVIKTPLQPDKFPDALKLAKLVEGAEPGSPDAKFASFLGRLLGGMYDTYVPTDITAQPPEPDEHTLSFAFLRGSERGRSVLATSREMSESSAKSPLSFYLLNTESGPLWTRKVKPEAFNLIAVASSGGSFLLGAASNGVLDNQSLYHAQSARFYNDNSENKGKIGVFHYKKFSFPLISAPTQWALSDDGDWYAYAAVDSGDDRSVPTVEVRSTSDENRSQNKIDFTGVRDEFQDKWKISRLSFDHDTRTLVVGVTGSPLLLAFGLLPDPERQKKIRFNTPVLGWDHSVDGKIAVVTQLQVLVDDLRALRDGDKTNPLVLSNFHGSTKFTCAAFSPQGMTLAIGDDAGTVSIRLLGKSVQKGKEVLRLLAGNGRAIKKLAFSFDGRVLAAPHRPWYNRAGWWRPKSR